MTALPADVAALLTAVHDALDIPLPALTGADQRGYDSLLAIRASDVRIAVGTALACGVSGSDAVWLRKQIARQPVTYTPWQPRAEQDGVGSEA